MSFRDSCSLYQSRSESASLRSKPLSPSVRSSCHTGYSWMKHSKSVALLLKPQSCWHSKCVEEEEGCTQQSSRWWPLPPRDGGKGSAEQMLGWLIGMAGAACSCQAREEGETAEKTHAEEPRGENASTAESLSHTRNSHSSAALWRDLPHLAQWLRRVAQLLITKLRQCYESGVIACLIFVKSVFSSVWPTQWNYVTVKEKKKKKTIISHAVKFPMLLLCLRRAKTGSSGTAFAQQGLRMTDASPESSWLITLLKEFQFRDEVI